MKRIRAKAFALGLDNRIVFNTGTASAFFATSLMLALSVSGFAQTLDTAKLDQFLDRLAEKNKARAIGYGQINGAEMKPLTGASRFRIASITKTYTAVVTADDKLQLFNGIVTFKFYAATNQMILTRGPLSMVFTKEV